MPSLMKTNARPIAVNTSNDPIADACVERFVCRAEEIKERYREQVTLYAGGLPAELATLATLGKSVAAELEKNYLRQIGRPIDLKALLGQRDAKRRPVWTVANPLWPVSTCNGDVEDDGDVCVKISAGKFTRISTGKQILDGNTNVTPTGIPPLPQEARDIVNNDRLQSYAKWIGVLYQPDGWSERKDPAIVVEWEALPGEYFCLAIWGGDRSQIEEFVV